MKSLWITSSPPGSANGSPIPVAGRPARWLPLRAESAQARWVLPANPPRIGNEFEIELRVDADGEGVWVTDLGTADRVFRQWPFPQNLHLIEILEPTVEAGPIIRFRLRVRAEPSEHAVRIPAATLAYFSPTLNRFLTLVVPAAEFNVNPPEPFVPETIVAPVGTDLRGTAAGWLSPTGLALAILGISAAVALLWLRRVRGMRTTRFSNHAGESIHQRRPVIEPVKTPASAARSTPQVGSCESERLRPTTDPVASLVDQLAVCCRLLPGQQTSDEIVAAVARMNRFNAADLETFKRDLGEADAVRFGGQTAPSTVIEKVRNRLESWLARVECPASPPFPGEEETNQSPSNSTSQ